MEEHHRGERQRETGRAEYEKNGLQFRFQGLSVGRAMNHALAHVRKARHVMTGQSSIQATKMAERYYWMGTRA